MSSSMSQYVQNLSFDMSFRGPEDQAKPGSLVSHFLLSLTVKMLLQTSWLLKTTHLPLSNCVN